MRRLEEVAMTLVDADRTSLRAADGSAARLRVSARPLAPLALIPLGAAYCLIYDLFFEEGVPTIAQSLSWAVATLTPWVVAAIAFERSVRAGDRRARLLRRAVALAIVAYLLSALAALLLGSGAERAFYSRLPLLAVAVLAAMLYPIPRPAESPAHAAADENTPPVAPGDIVFASAAGNYIELHAGERTIVWRQTMLNAERILRPAGFVRVHRSYLVPWRSIEEVRRGRKGPVEVALRNGRRLPVSGRYAANLRV